MLNENELREATLRGWVVCEVFDLSLNRLRVQVLPAPNNAIKNAEDLLKVVTHRATAGEPFAKRVLQLITESNMPQPKRKKK